MNPKHFHVRMNPQDGRLWLTHEKWGAPIKRVKDITDEVLLGLCSDVTAEADTRAVEREVKFNPPGGTPWAVRFTAELIGDVN